MDAVSVQQVDADQTLVYTRCQHHAYKRACHLAIRILVAPRLLRTAMVLKIHGITLSPNVQMVIFICKELGLEYEVVPVDISTGVQKTEPFLQKNPFGQIPVLEVRELLAIDTGPNSCRCIQDDGFVLAGVPA